MLIFSKKEQAFFKPVAISFIVSSWSSNIWQRLLMAVSYTHLYGTKCAITDFSILWGGYVSQDCYTSEGNARKDRTGWWWTKSFYDNGARAVPVSYTHLDVYKRQVQTATTDNLSFQIGGSINLTANQEDFGQGMPNESGLSLIHISLKE